MKLSLLIDELPETAGGMPIRSGFRYLLELDALLRDREIPPRDKLALALGIFYLHPEQITDFEAAVDAMLDFYLCGERPRGDSPQSGGAGSAKRVYDFTQDAAYIYASFRQAYGINLARDDLHWWEFTALFAALPEDCIMSRIMAYRGMDLKGMKGRQLRFYKEMQARYRLDAADVPQYDSKEERDRAYRELADRRFAEAQQWKKEQESGR